MVSAAIDDIPAAELADQLGKTDTVFRLGAQGTAQLGSAIDRLQDAGASGASGILNITQRLSGSAVAAGITAQETTALAATLLDTGTNAELGASSIQRLLMSLNN